MDAEDSQGRGSEQKQRGQGEWGQEKEERKEEMDA